ncbi:hypothetical protein AVEN_235149-1 [Araneus ventricosus]|uniref:Uncharacterized protein n=1 Tax=Araneus ventricosus TaxID=182803 RepID=A0A4Y2M234_ARAVE|nr:hypothetical protein AVEN_235149-1 [Araneus ventricosus]
MICYKHEEKRRHTFNVVPTLHRLVRYPEVRQITFAEEHLREDMETLVQGEAKQCTSQSEFIPLSLWTQFQYWMPSSDSPEHISNGVNLQVRPKYGGR